MRFFLLIIITILFISCGRSENNDELVCSYGQTKPCTCSDGSDGSEVCYNNAWKSCECRTDEMCEDISCSGNGRCLVKNGNPTCKCNDGYHIDDLNCIKDGEENPCDNEECIENSHCVVEKDDAVCVCNKMYVLDDNVCIFDCSGTDNSHVNEDNNNCVCNEGYTLKDGNCIQDSDFKCIDYDCENAHSHCIVEDNSPKCVCDTGYKTDGALCILDCSSIENSHLNERGDSCVCNKSYHYESDLCESNQKVVGCKAVVVPDNGHLINEDVVISWTEDEGWELPVLCKWECNDKYQDNDDNGTCELSCDNDTCENGTCTDSSGTIDCTCDYGYQDNNNDEVCLPSCALTEVDGVECGGHGVCYDNTGVLFCICDSGYQDNDNNGSCKERCHIDLMAPELSTCGQYGECNDSSGEIICSCSDGYFVNPITGKCTAPCDDVDCGKHGECTAFSLNNIGCLCDSGYQDNNNNLICKKSCTSSCLFNSTSCNDSSGELICQCDFGYQDNDRDGTCLPDCSDISCTETSQVIGSCVDDSGFPVCSYSQGYNYTNIISGTNEQIINDSAVDSNGNLYLVGSFKGVVDFDPTTGVDEKSSPDGEDIFITRINADNSYGWTYHIGSESFDGAQAIAIDDYDNLYITGYFSSTVDFDTGGMSSLMVSDGYRDIFILKLTNKGEYNWSKQIMSTDTGKATSIKLDNNSIYLTGYFIGSNNSVINVDFDKTSNAGNFELKGREDGFIAKFKILDGSYIWANVFGDSLSYNRALDLVVLDDSIVITGGVNGNIDFDSNNENQGSISAVNKFETFLLKLSKNNQFIWLNSISSQSSADTSKGVKLEVINNDIYLLGFLMGNVDFNTNGTEDIVNAGTNQSIYIAKVTEDGIITDKDIFISTNSSSMIKDSFTYNNSIYLLGEIRGSLNIQGTTIVNTSSDSNKNDVFWIKIDTSLNVSNIVNFGGELNDSASSVSIGNSGEIYILGMFEGTTDFNPDNEINNKTSLEMRDIFISRFTD